MALPHESQLSFLQITPCVCTLFIPPFEPHVDEFSRGRRIRSWQSVCVCGHSGPERKNALPRGSGELTGDKLMCTFTSQSGTPPQNENAPGITSPSRLVVFGGNGYVGTRVAEAALRRPGVKQVTCVARRGRPEHLHAGTWADSVEWVKGDALDPAQPWRSLLGGDAGVVSTIGAFGSNEAMYRTCGTANVQLMRAAAETGVARFAFISVHDYRLPGAWHAQDFLLKGYFQGKRDAEKELAKLFPDTGVALRPGFIAGTRYIGTREIHLGAFGTVLNTVLKPLQRHGLAAVPIIGAAFVPVLSVETVGKVAARAALDPSIPPGPMDAWEIGKVGRET